MKLSAILLARALAFIETTDLNPLGRAFFPEWTAELVKRYSFQGFPQTLEQFDVTKGIVFRAGKLGDKVIESLTIFNVVIAVETRSGTSDSKEILEDMFEWGKQSLGLAYDPSMVRHWAYISDISFYSDVQLLDKSSNPLSRLADKTGKALSEIWKENITYESTVLSAGHDKQSRQNSIAPFTISRRENIPFADGKYFSEAPLPTDLHIKMVEEFEADVKAYAAKNPEAWHKLNQ